MDVYEFAMNLLKKNPDKANTPLGKQLMGILESKNYAAGEELGKNICNTYGVNPEEAYDKGKTFFGL